MLGDDPVGFCLGARPSAETCLVPVYEELQITVYALQRTICPIYGSFVGQTFISERLLEPQTRFKREVRGIGRGDRREVLYVEPRQVSVDFR